jgi:hypothetical protein
MNVVIRYFTMFLASAWMLGSGAAVAATDICPMGGTMIVTPTDRDKTLTWAKGRPKADITEVDAADWSALTFSVADEGIAVYITPGKVFFGVAGRWGETYPKDIEKAFGAGFPKLKDAMGKTLADLVAAGAVKLEAADIQAIAGAAGLGVLEKGASGWTLSTRDCQAVDLSTSGL